MADFEGYKFSHKVGNVTSFEVFELISFPVEVEVYGCKIKIYREDDRDPGSEGLFYFKYKNRYQRGWRRDYTVEGFDALFSMIISRLIRLKVLDYGEKGPK